MKKRNQKNRQNRLLLLLFLAAPVAACAQDTLSGHFQLRGELPFLKDVGKAYLNYTGADDSLVRDSTPVKNGLFIFTGLLREPQLAQCRIVQKSTVDGKDTVFVKGDLQIFLEPAVIGLRYDERARRQVITGSLLTQQYEELKRLKDAYRQEIVSGNARYNKMSQTGRDSLSALIERKRNEELDSLYAPFLSSHKDGYISSYALQQYVHPGMDADKTDSLYRQLPEKLRALPSGKKMRMLLDLAMAVDVGRPAIDFVQPDTAGRPVRLSSFRGKYLLLDFWASWCGPCRAENPVVVKAFKAYKDQNFTILSVSMDLNKKAWLRAVRHDGLDWTHVGDMSWDNKAANLYNIGYIPSNILIDPAGMIIAKDLHGAALEKKLSEILGNP